METTQTLILFHDDDLSLQQSAKYEVSPFQQVANILKTEDFPYHAGWKFATKKDGKTRYCALGYLAKKKGVSDLRLRSSTVGNVLKGYGFSKEELLKLRLCPVQGCKFTTDLEYMIGHLNVKHKLSPKEIADHIEKMQCDARPIPSWWKQIYYEWKFGA